jgi:hypothetical protein
VDLGQRFRSGAPDPAEAGGDVEAGVGPRQRVHVPDPQVGVGVAVPGHRDQPRRGVDARAACAAQPGQFERETRSAGDVDQPVAPVDAQPVLHRDVLAHAVGLGQRREIDCLAAPALVDHLPDRVFSRHGR